MPPPIDATALAIIRDDLRLTTWLLVGACLQSLLLFILPIYFAVLPALVLLGVRIVWTVLMLTGVVHDTTLDKTVRGRQTSQFPAGAGLSEKANDEEFVVFIIGARFNQWVYVIRVALACSQLICAAAP